MEVSFVRNLGQLPSMRHLLWQFQIVNCYKAELFFESTYSSTEILGGKIIIYLSFTVREGLKKNKKQLWKIP